jgi:hypothetical protein
MPFIPQQSLTIDQLQLEVTTAGAAATTARLGIYSSTTAGAPDAVIVQGGSSIDTATTGLKTVSFSSTTLNAGTVYWIAVHSSGAPTYRGLTAASVLALACDATASNIYTLRRAAPTYGATLPATAPATTNTASVVPNVRLRHA